jgi:hypothetical protein
MAGLTFGFEDRLDVAIESNVRGERCDCEEKADDDSRGVNFPPARGRRILKKSFAGHGSAPQKSQVIDLPLWAGAMRSL